MKLSLAWIFDHLQAPWTSVNASDLVAKLNQTTAEVEDFCHYNLDLKQFLAIKVISCNEKEYTVECPEKRKKFILPARKDLILDSRALIYNDPKAMRWATLQDIHSTKDGLIPALSINDEQLKGSWRDSIETSDYVLTIDNKSITHRPDLWSHRGFAREIGALLDIPLQSEDMLLANKAIKQYERIAPVTESQKIALEIKDPVMCKRLAGIYIETTVTPSIPSIALRLARIDARPINTIVDSTNYVMLDIGQPMHAFDADKITTKKLVAQRADNKTHLALLDGQTIELSNNDIIISDGQTPLSLAGIMGGASTAISNNSHRIFLESGNFDAGHIRKSSTMHKRRTESSVRFEKSLDPNLNTVAILRALKLLEAWEVPYTSATTISSVGKLASELTIEIPHELFAARLGRIVTSDNVVTILTKLGFGVSIYNTSNTTSTTINNTLDTNTNSDTTGMYSVNIPSFRATKDVTIKEDIIEEVGRFLTYSNAIATLPLHSTQPVDNSLVMATRTIKHTLAYGALLKEVYNYALYDNEFLHELDYTPTHAPTLKNPVSEHWRVMVTSLIPHLLKNVVHNKSKQDILQFFELARIWHESTTITEHQALAGIFAATSGPIDFYMFKNKLNQLFDAINLTVEWEKPTHDNRATINTSCVLFGEAAPWWHEYQTASLTVNNKCIGYAGTLSPEYATKLGFNAFIFESDAGYLINYKAPLKVFKPASKYQAVSLDISVLVPTTITVAQLQKAIAQADPRITEIQLLERFEKSEWENQRSHTFRFVTVDPEKTMTKEDIDDIWDSVIATLTHMGGTIR